MENDSAQTEIAINKDVRLTSGEDLKEEKVEENQKPKTKAQGFGLKSQGLQVGTIAYVANNTLGSKPDHTSLSVKHVQRVIAS